MSEPTQLELPLECELPPSYGFIDNSYTFWRMVPDHATDAYIDRAVDKLLDEGMVPAHARTAVQLLRAYTRLGAQGAPRAQDA